MPNGPNVPDQPITDAEITSAMRQYGGSFVKKLGELFDCADADNYVRLKRAFPECWTRYTETAQQHRERQDAQGGTR